MVESTSDIKVELTRRLMEIDDRAVLDEVYALLNNASEDDDGAKWYENLSAEDKASIERGRADIAEGRVISTKELMEEVRTWGKR